MATIGQPLTAPEAGWKRYDDTHPAIKYITNNRTYLGTSSSSSYNGTTSTIYNLHDRIAFKFDGTKIRLIVLINPSRSRNITVKINNVAEGTLDLYNKDTSISQVLIFEKTNLPRGTHTVELIKNDETNGFSLDAIDIDSTGRLLHPDEVTTIKDLEVGKRIRCHYQAAVNTTGVFSGLGEEISDFISASSSATPNGDFYFIMVDEGNDMKKLIADRNVQHSIGWNTLNSSGVSSGSGLPIDLGVAGVNFNCRLLTGGISSTDKDNEWDEYIVRSNLKGSIVAGDNYVWNWNGIYSWTSSTKETTAAQRVNRGYTVTGYTWDVTDLVAVTRGFRPVLEIEASLLNRVFIFSNENYMRWNDATKNWDVISDTLPTKQQFIDKGMDTIPDWSALSQLTGEIEIVTWTEEENAQRDIEMIAIPQDQIVLPTKDINIRSVENIDSFTLRVMQEGQGVIKTAVSFDSGITWYTRSSGMWVEMGLNNIKTEGMTPVVLNAITSSEWAALRGTSSTVRFAYYLSVEEVTDLATVNDLVSQMDMKGTWRKAVHGTDYDYEYPNNDQLTVTIYQSGDYKINY